MVYSSLAVFNFAFYHMPCISKGLFVYLPCISNSVNEFLNATGKDKLSEVIISKPEKLPEPIHSLLLESLRQFMFIGGMPACVEVWRNSNSMADVFEVQSEKQFCRGLLLKDYPHTEQGYVLSAAPYGELPEQKLTFLPLYYAFGQTGKW